VFLAAALFCSASGAYAQSAAFATITGRAQDPQGALVPNATVTATNTETGITRTTQTTGEGLYHFSSLTPGVYDVIIDASGFTRAVVKDVKLQVGEERDVNFTLQVAGAKESIVVGSEVPLIELTRTDISSVIDEKVVADIPTSFTSSAYFGAANDYQGLASSTPGIRYDYGYNSGDIEGPGATNNRGINVNIDGGTITDMDISSRDSLGASLEEVKEFQVITNNYNAEYGQAGNVILNVITKSGTNSFHGDAHGYIRGTNLEASDWFYNQSLFFTETPASNPANCPVSDFTNGTLTSVQGCDRPHFFKHEEGFTAGGPFVKDRVFWFGSFEKVAQGAPATFTPFGIPTIVNQPTNEILGSFKLDAKLTEKHSLSLRYNEQRDTEGNQNYGVGPEAAPSALVSAVGHDNTFNVGMTSMLTPHVVNEARFFWHRFVNVTPSYSSLPGEELPDAYVGANPGPGYNTTRFQYIDNVSWVHGTHTFKFGENITHFLDLATPSATNVGVYSNFVPGDCTNSYFPQANGWCPTEYTFSFRTGVFRSYDNAYGLYAQDTWQLKRNLTINYGLRYDVEDGALKGGRTPAPVPGGCLEGNGLLPACGSDHNNWQPRLGIAWSPNFEHGILHGLFGDSGKSVVRLSAARITELVALNIERDSIADDGVSILRLNIAANSVGTDGKTTGQELLNAYPNQPSTNMILLFRPIGFYGNVYPISPTAKNPQMYMGSMTIQRQIGSSFTFSIGYQGTFGDRLMAWQDSNFPTPIQDPSNPGYYYFPAIPGTVNDRPNPAFGMITYAFSDRTSQYNSLVISAQKHLSKHFQFMSSYTWGHLISNGDDFWFANQANPFAPLKAEKGSSLEDIRHLFNFNFVVDTTNLIHTPVLSHMFNNWTVGLIGTLQSGRPYPVSTGSIPFTGENVWGLGSDTPQRPNICRPGSTIPGCAGAPVGSLVATNIASAYGANYAVSSAGIAACNAAGVEGCPTTPTTFAAPANASVFGPVDSISGTPVDFQYLSGNLGHYAGQSDALYRFDASVGKAFAIPKWETAKLELKLEAFNMFNHPLFAYNIANDALTFMSLPSLTVPDPNNPNGTIPNPNYATCTGCINPVTGLYIGLNGKPLNLSNFERESQKAASNYFGLGGASGTIMPRILQIALRLRW
jgi:hypothetical protein